MWKSAQLGKQISELLFKAVKKKLSLRTSAHTGVAIPRSFHHFSFIVVCAHVMIANNSA